MHTVASQLQKAAPTWRDKLVFQTREKADKGMTKQHPVLLGPFPPRLCTTETQWKRTFVDSSPSPTPPHFVRSLQPLEKTRRGSSGCHQNLRSGDIFFLFTCVSFTLFLVSLPTQPLSPSLSHCLSPPHLLLNKICAIDFSIQSHLHLKLGTGISLIILVLGS